MEHQLHTPDQIEEAVFRHLKPFRDQVARNQVEITDARHDLDVHVATAGSQYEFLVESLQRIEGKVDCDHEALISIKHKLFNGFFDGVYSEIRELKGTMAALHVRVDGCEDRDEAEEAIKQAAEWRAKRAGRTVGIIGGTVGVVGTLVGVLAATGVL